MYMSIRSVKICMMCCLTKQIKYESDFKKRNYGKGGTPSPFIHEYNFTCYECLESMAKRRENELKDIYKQLQLVGIIPQN